MSSKIMSKVERLSEPPSLITLLPYDIIVDILGRVSRFDYPTLSLVSKHFRSLVTSPEVYARRSLLGCTEHCLYVVLSDRETEDKRWYMLLRKANGNCRLVLIPSLPVMPRGCSRCFVSVGSRIYVFGSMEDHTSAFSIDCRSHTVQPLPSMPTPIIENVTVAHIIDGKIYVFGYCNYCENDRTKMVMVVFNTKTQMWESGLIKPNVELDYVWSGFSVVMADKIYTRDLSNKNYMYEPKKSRWEADEMLISNKWKFACVVDEVLYYYHCDFFHKELRAYNPKQKCWRLVKGLELLLPEMTSALWEYAVSYGGNLALFFSKRNNSGITREISCAEISLETRQGGEIWGQVEWCKHFLTGESRFAQSLDVVI